MTRDKSGRFTKTPGGAEPAPQDQPHPDPNPFMSITGTPGDKIEVNGVPVTIGEMGDDHQHAWLDWQPMLNGQNERYCVGCNLRETRGPIITNQVPEGISPVQVPSAPVGAYGVIDEPVVEAETASQRPSSLKVGRTVKIGDQHGSWVEIEISEGEVMIKTKRGQQVRLQSTMDIDAITDILWDAKGFLE